MSTLVVSCDRWLGFAAHYVVRVNDKGVGRLGKRCKQVRVEVPPGLLKVSVTFAGNSTPAELIDLAEGEEARFDLVFGSVVDAVARRRLMPWRQRLATPIGKTSEGLMTLVRAG